MSVWKGGYRKGKGHFFKAAAGLVSYLLSSPAVLLGISDARAADASKTAAARTGAASANSTGSFAQGQVMRKPFLVKFAFYDGGRRLMLRTERQVSRSIMPDTFQGIELDFPVDETLSGQYVVNAEEETMNVRGESQKRPVLFIYHTDGEGDMDKWLCKSPFSLKLEFYKPGKGLLPGYIELNAPRENTAIKGFFYAAPGSGW